MTMLRIQNLGQIVEADLDFGDLTALVGPQASGKSIALQVLKLMVDAGYVQAEMRRYGLDWSGDLLRFLDAYLGEGMSSIWRPKKSSIDWAGKSMNLEEWARRKRREKEESLFYIPAQRVLALRDGWPRPFTDYSAGDPFAVREFSEKLRILLEKEFTASSHLFPQAHRLKEGFRGLLNQHVFSGFELKVETYRAQKRLMLGAGKPGDSSSLPYMVWSAGQREFVPLLLGLYWLMPGARVSQRREIKWVVLEELEMGLHPRAISVVLLLVFELLARGYRVCLSTHSPQVLEAIWALRLLRETGADEKALLSIFQSPCTQPMRKMARTVLKKVVKAYYFNRETGTVSDISNLDPSAEMGGEADWGGLVEFSARANEAVAQAVANAESGK